MLIGFVVAGGCSDFDPASAECAADRGECRALQGRPIDPDGDTYVYVVDTITLPDSATVAQEIGMDLDGDPQCRPDNAFGQILSTTFRFFDADGSAIGNEFIAQGRILHLVELTATSLDDADGVGAQIHIGIDEDGIAGNNFSGVETFAIDPRVSGEAMTGRFVEGRLTADIGVVPLQVAIPRVDEPALLTMTATRIELRVVDGRVDARLAGALLPQSIDALVAHAAAAMSDIVAEDCPGGSDQCAPGSKGEELVDLFDSNRDGRIGAQELGENDLINSLLSPDLDLYDADGRLNPRCDEVKDSLSIGIAFTAVPARFASPPPSMPER